MKKHYYLKFLLLLIPVSAFLLMSSSGGRDGGTTGSPGDSSNTCTQCHSAGANFNLSPSITTNIPASGYELNKAYTINVNSTSSSSKLGFQLTAENGSNTKIGAFTAGSGSRVSGQRITHSSPSSSGNWSFTWTSPSSNEGDVTFYTAVNATNGNGSTSGDQVVTTNTTAQVLGISTAKRLQFDMYPNPASESISIQLPSGSNKATVQFYDYVGRLALTKNISSANDNINVRDLSSGVYILKVISEDKIGSQKFVKN
ncbi:choice-of-anchor V domain-containing protein [Polaribacter sp. Hel1_85]|uniref:choice-of-anchor V domain-containing protein n=1 Tax=Polaribacter sp. Hel1_85 TaxID=1250005 RepID=UPI00052DA8C8|nr:choice-of-anchor V domain-containing protein [Polaribacter sp. Hel1_85]KGL63285.1 Reeler domain protein-containing protein [Polaribacter sp. Hel1_85]